MHNNENRWPYIALVLFSFVFGSYLFFLTRLYQAPSMSVIRTLSGMPFFQKILLTRLPPILQNLFCYHCPQKFLARAHPLKAIDFCADY